MSDYSEHTEPEDSERLIKGLEKDRLQRERKQLKSQLNSAEDEDQPELQHRIREIKEKENKYYK